MAKLSLFLFCTWQTIVRDIPVIVTMGEIYSFYYMLGTMDSERFNGAFTGVTQ